MVRSFLACRSLRPRVASLSGFVGPLTPLRQLKHGPIGVAVATSALVLGIGCQSGDRFAEGLDNTPRVAYSQGGENLTPPDQIIPPPPVIAPIPQADATPQSAPTFPAAWAPRGHNRPWRYIVVHHSATPTGDAATIDKVHRQQGWDELGYHFVVGNGTDTGDGLVEVGPRWRKQKHGAHAKTPDNRFNDYGIGICLVGNFEHSRPSQKQMQSLATLTAFLMQRYDIPASAIIGHQDTGRSTACPGEHLENQLTGVRRLAARAVANGFASDTRILASMNSR